MKFLNKIFKRSIKIHSINKELIEQSVDIFLGDYNEEEKFNEIQKLTSSRDDALILYLFIPYVFCQFFLPEVSYTDHYFTTDKSDNEIKHKFADSKLYMEMREVISQNWENYKLERNFMNVLWFSAEFKAINKLVKQKSDLKNIISAAPRVIND